jgi:predicted phage terminase large subunit-like protein
MAVSRDSHMVESSKLYIPKLPPLHSAQQQVFESEARWKILCAGRRFGKTRLGVQMCMEVALRGGRAWWVAPTFAIARVGWRDIQATAQSFPKEIEPVISIANMEFTLANGGQIAVRSADNPQRLRGEGLDFIVMDEAAFVKPEVWAEVLRPTLTERKGSALFISTPMGMNNWFYNLWETAEKGDNWERFRFSTYDNPRIDPVEAGQGMIKPEWMKYWNFDENGDFVLDGQTYFKKECTIFLATDIATSVDEDADYTAIIAFALTKDNKMIVLDCKRERYEGPDILGAINQMINKHSAGWVTMERQGFQLSLIQMAKRQGMRVKEVKPDKDKVARALTLSARMEAGDVYFKGDAPWLDDMERELFTFPVGAHDDMVDALGYGVLNLNERRQWNAY